MADDTPNPETTDTKPLDKPENEGESKRVTLDQVGELMDEKLEKALAPFKTLLGGNKGDGGDSTDEAPSGSRHMEAQAKSAVEKAVAALGLTAPATPVKQDKVEPETNPIKKRFSTRAMGW